jgi:hypothetical protein
MQSVRSSARELENANALGETILLSIHGQRERLKVSTHFLHLLSNICLGLPFMSFLLCCKW